MLRTLSGIVLLVLTAVGLPARAQSYTQTARSFVQAPQALGMGDAGVAFPTEATVFFYNPAHVAHVAPLRPHVTIVGLRGSVTSNVVDQVDFYRNELNPAIERGLENLGSDELEALYDRALARGRTRTLVNGDVLLPSLLVRAGGVGVGAGLFAHSVAYYTFDDAGAGLPAVDLAGHADAMGIASAGFDFSTLGVPGFSAGLSLKYTRRYLTLKAKTLDTIAPDESLYLFTGTSTGVDLGLLYELDFVPVPGRLTFGVALYDVGASDFAYTYDRNLNNDEAESDPQVIAMERMLAQEQHGLSRSSRVGVAYTVPSLGVLGETGFALDYAGYADPRVEQAFLTHLRLGVQAQVLRTLAVRLGISQGYTTFGAGLHVGAVRFDYAYYGVEQGRFPGQLPSWNHSLQRAIGIF